MHTASSCCHGRGAPCWRTQASAPPSRRRSEEPSRCRCVVPEPLALHGALGSQVVRGSVSLNPPVRCVDVTRRKVHGVVFFFFLWSNKNGRVIGFYLKLFGVLLQFRTCPQEEVHGNQELKCSVINTASRNAPYLMLRSSTLSKCPHR